MKIRNMRGIKRVNAIYLKVLEGTGVEQDLYREEEYIYFDDDDELFVVDRGRNMLKAVEEEE
jgi:hypothetical protein